MTIKSYYKADPIAKEIYKLECALIHLEEPHETVSFIVDNKHIINHNVNGIETMLKKFINERIKQLSAELSKIK